MNQELATLEELLAEGFNAQAECYAQAAELISGWLARPTETLDELVAVLERQQKLIDAATEIDQTLIDAKARWRELNAGKKPGQQLQEALDRLRHAIAQLIGLNDLLRGHALEARQEVRARLDELRAGDQAARAYRDRRGHTMRAGAARSHHQQQK